MWTNNRSKLIKNLNQSALGLIAEAEQASPEQAQDLIELAGTLDHLRVKLLREPECTLSEIPLTSLTSARYA